MVKARPVSVIVKWLAPELKMPLLISVAAESEMLVTVLVAKVAVSPDPLGMVAGVQSADLFRSCAKLSAAMNFSRNSHSYSWYWRAGFGLR